MSHSEAKKEKSGSGRLVFLIFLAFFGVIILVNGVFAYLAITSQTGLVTEKPYEKGLAYNETLAEARSQPALQDSLTYDGAVLVWVLKDAQSVPIENATATATIKRPVQEGYDFDITLEHKGNGTYSAPLSLPMKGQWRAELSSQWDNQHYNTTQTFLAK